MAPIDTATMTAAEFDRRVKAADGYVNRALIWLWTPAGIAFAVLLAWIASGGKAVPEWLGNASVVAMLGFSMAGMVAALVREPRAVRRFGLLCPGCDAALPGGKTDEITVHVRKTGCCRACGAPVLRDHPGAAEAAAREAAVTRSAPHASAFARDEFDRRLADYRRRVQRRITFVIALGLAGMPAIAGIVFLPLERSAKAALMQGGAFVLPVVLLGIMFGGRSTWRRVGLECPACRGNPLGGPDISVVRTGICPHCSAVIIRPAP